VHGRTIIPVQNRINHSLPKRTRRHRIGFHPLM
jgi:hypothetical protein